MRALSVRQPWAWAILHGGKDVENRVTGIVGGYRGPVAIHAPMTEDTRALGDPMIREAMAVVPLKRQRTRHIRGVFLGVADLTDEHTENTCQQWNRFHVCSAWAQSGERLGRTMHHIVLTNPRPLEHEIPWPGRLGLWTPPAHLIPALEAA